MYRTRRVSGFTLLEIMVVVVILGVLAAIVTPGVLGAITDARIEAAKSDIRTIESALTLYRMDNFRYPSTELGLRALVERPPAADAPHWKSGGYLKKRKLPTDPWGNAYRYANDGTEIDIYTLGSDRRPGGEGEAGDIHWIDL